MKDIVYIADLPAGYKYAVFSNDYITLYNVASAMNQTITGYRFYYHAPAGYYSAITTTVSSTRQYYEEVRVSNSVWARQDIAQILVVVMIVVLFVKYLVNTFSRVAFRGGVL